MNFDPIGVIDMLKNALMKLGFGKVMEVVFFAGVTAGAVAGSIAGVAAGLAMGGLMAPKSGEDLRQDIANKTNELANKTSELTNEFGEAMKQKSEMICDKAKKIHSILNEDKTNDEAEAV
jgi:gas vesicle protein